MAQANPFDQFDTAPAPAAGPVYGAPADPYKAASDARAERADQRSQAEFDLKYNQAPTPGDTTKAGDEYLSTLNPALAAQVRALSEGRRAFPTGSALRSPQVQELVAAASQYDPSLDAANAATRVATRKDFTSGKAAANVTAMNTALGHLGSLADAAGQLDNRSFPLWNSVANMAETATGDPRVKNFTLARNAVANELMKVFRGTGGSVSEIEEWQHNIDSSDSPDQLRATITKATELLRSRLEAMNDQYTRGMGKSGDPLELLSPHAQEIYNRITTSTNPLDGDHKAAATVAPDGGNGGGPAAPPPGGGPATPPVIGPGPDKMEVATGDNRRVADPEMTAQLDQMVRKGMPLADINQFLGAKGMAPVGPHEYGQVQDFLKQHPDYQGSVARAWKLEPQNGFEKVIGQISANPIGGAVAGYAAGAGQFLTGNTLDNIAPDPERARGSLDMLAEQHPTATAIGGVSGGIMGSVAGEAGLARLGMGATAGRGLLADMAMGGANGAGAADGGDRVTGGIRGALEAGAGSLAGTGVMKGAARLAAPSGGELAGLYASGVRPTIGQRAAAFNGGRGVSGTIGKAINATEEGLQSVPIVGAAIRGARQEARDQFQTGAFNEALKEVGEQLPKGMTPGTDPHAYTQRVFSRAYDAAREGMHMVADEGLSTDLGNLAAPIAELGPQARNKLKAIMANVVTPKVADGEMTGANFKKVVSDLGKRIERFRKSDASDDQAMADILDGVQSAIEGAARRHSDPEAVKLLDAADAGYAKFVRIEDAARRRGGEAGTFSPAQFDASVQNTSGGVRSKAYLRGDALMQDYAKAGRALEDKMPNSGTTDRAMIAGTAGAGLAGFLEPSTLAVLGAIGAAYAPGVRKVAKAAIAPRGAAAARIRQQLEKIGRISGATAASTAVVGAQGTSPSP